MGSLLVSGCSFTNYKAVVPDIHKIENTDFDFWPDILSKHLNKKLINVGRVGASNDYISCSVIPHIEEADIVCILLTDWLRLSLYNIPGWCLNLSGQPAFSTDHLPDHLDYIESSYRNNKRQMLGLELIKNFQEIYQTNNFIGSVVHHQIYKNILPLQEICNHRNIKLIIMQGLAPFNLQSWLLKLLDYEFTNEGKLDLKIIINEIIKYEKYINTNNFLGWPIYEEIGGFHWSFGKREDMVMSKHNAHPNKKGHQWLAEQFLQFM